MFIPLIWGRIALFIPLQNSSAVGRQFPAIRMAVLGCSTEVSPLPGPWCAEECNAKVIKQSRGRAGVVDWDQQEGLIALLVHTISSFAGASLLHRLELSLGQFAVPMQVQHGCAGSDALVLGRHGLPTSHQGPFRTTLTTWVLLQLMLYLHKLRYINSSSNLVSFNPSAAS